MFQITKFVIAAALTAIIAAPMAQASDGTTSDVEEEGSVSPIKKGGPFKESFSKVRPYEELKLDVLKLNERLKKERHETKKYRDTINNILAGKEYKCMEWSSPRDIEEGSIEETPSPENYKKAVYYMKLHTIELKNELKTEYYKKAVYYLQRLTAELMREIKGAEHENNDLRKALNNLLMLQYEEGHDIEKEYGDEITVFGATKSKEYNCEKYKLYFERFQLEKLRLEKRRLKELKGYEEGKVDFNKRRLFSPDDFVVGEDEVKQYECEEYECEEYQYVKVGFEESPVYEKQAFKAKKPYNEVEEVEEVEKWRTGSAQEGIRAAMGSVCDEDIEYYQREESKESAKQINPDFFDEGNDVKRPY